MKPKVYLGLPVPDDVVQRIEAECDVIPFGERGKPAKPDLLAALADVDGVLSHTRVPFDTEVFAAAPNLRVVSNFGVGYDNVDVPAATEHGVLVCNTPGVLSDAVADLTLGLIIALARNIVVTERLVHEGQWGRGGGMLGLDLKGKQLGLIGFGRIGRAVARRAQAFGMSVCFHDQFEEPGEGFGYCAYASFDDLLRESDFVSLHVNLSAETTKLIGARALGLMRPTAYLINTSRGGVVDQAALTQALRDGQIAGAALDVLEREPPAEGEPILEAPNVVLVPHIGSATRETRRAMLDLAVDNLLAALRGDMPQCVVNPEALAARKST
jgi:lactate dehydrogenase-like 2-hydroxyacid dehydrogenase